ncbi:uncharacterized protein L203_103421 [Cryptococcus depauperatus CBS 7841]|uniref:Uncharacterized protein n=1 Tax=Cryptococcus depauperatus CBS 7841 TaxID=1295531 RepID=A0A1E3IKY4_9TREE|nr:hypothetical protein L203_02984 [Cryptococcus depauperatus CBS 7841]
MGDKLHTAVSQTPLDLLVNAITSDHTPIQEPTNTQGGVNLDQFLSQERGYGESHLTPSRKRPQTTYSTSPRQQKTMKIPAPQATLSSPYVPVDARHNRENINSSQTSTTIEVWHPTTSQKSYGKERRMLNPPPIVRMTGFIALDVLHVTLSTLTQLSQDQEVTVSGSQTLRLGSLLDPASRMSDTSETDMKRSEKLEEKRKLREAALSAGFGATLPSARAQVDVKRRQSLRDGLTFPGLWVGDEVGKAKDFKLELKVTRRMEAERHDQFMTPSRDTLDHSYEPAANGQDGHNVKVLADMLAPPPMKTPQQLDEKVACEADNHPEGMSAEQDDFQLYQEPHNQPEESQFLGQALQKEEALIGSFLSGPIRIVSKPSIKTAKARSMASCFSPQSAFSLWTRIYSQTVRTKYMNLEPNFSSQGPQLTSRTGKWTPFRFEVLQRVIPASTHHGSRSKYTDASSDEAVLTYGSIVCLVDLHSGVKSEPVKIVKVEQAKSVIGSGEGQPVSELQRIGLVRMVNGVEDLTGGSRWYLSAPGARLGGGELQLDFAPTTRAKGLSKGTRLKGGRTTKYKDREINKPDEISLASSFLQHPETLSAVESVATPSAIIQVGEQHAAADHEQQGDSRQLGKTTEHIDPTLLEHSLRTRILVTPEQTSNQISSSQKKKKRTKRLALAAAALAEDEDGGSQMLLNWTKAEHYEEMASSNSKGDDSSKQKTQHNVSADSVADWMSWTIGGVSSFSYTFFDAHGPVTSPSFIIDPISHLNSPSAPNNDSTTLDIALSEIFFSDKSHPE